MVHVYVDLVERFHKMYINNGINDHMKLNSHFQIPNVYIVTRQNCFEEYIISYKLIKLVKPNM